MSKSQKGLIVSEEKKQKMRNSHKERWEKRKKYGCDDGRQQIRSS
jgi:hypothetical protein